MKASSILPVCLLVFAAACGGGAADSTRSAAAPEKAGHDTQALSDAEIIELVYDPDYSVPAGFFADARASTPGSYTIHHVLDASGSFEVCTDDYQAALDIEAADNASRAVRGAYVSSLETTRYFEVTRELAYTDSVGNVSPPTSPGYARVFKCSDTRRDGVDRSLLDGFAGVINARPISAATVREFTEYLWQFRFFPGGRGIVLSSAGDAEGTSLRHSLHLAFRRSQGPGRCDLIELAEWQFTVNPASGEVAKQFTELRSFEARLDAGTPVLCD